MSQGAPLFNCPACGEPLDLDGSCETWDTPTHKYADKWFCSYCDLAIWNVYQFVEVVPDDEFETYQ